jgi:nicotinate dehydrogenase subunit B
MAITDPDLRPAEEQDDRISRRAFVAGAGALIVTFSVTSYLDPRAAEAKGQHLPPVLRPHFPSPPAAAPVTEGPPVAAVDSWLAVAADGTVTVFSGKAELGTGTATSTLQIVADQLSVAMDQLTIVEPDTITTVDQGFTAGSQTLKTQWAAGVRQAAAAARAKLLELASAALGVPVSGLQVADGLVSVQADPSRGLSYGQLIGGRKFELTINARVKPVPPSRRKLVGTSVKRIDIVDKVTAASSYVQDLRIKEMLHGRVVRPPTVDSELMHVPRLRSAGLVKVVVDKNFVGVVCHTEQQAIDAAMKLKPRWKLKPLPEQSTLFDSIRDTPPDTKRVLVETLINGGSVPLALKLSPKVVRATYRYPYQIHGPIGPPCALADVTDDEVTVWSGTQGVYPLRDAIAAMLRRKPEKVHVIYVEGSGCYGLDGEDNAALDAVLMSRAVGHPVRVQYMRADEHGWENYGQAMVMEAAAGIHPQSGRIEAWDYRTYAASRGGRPAPAGQLPTGGMIGLKPTPNPPSPPSSPPLGPDASNAVTNYDIPRSRVVSLTVPSRFFTGPMRSPTRIQNTFANESFMDELAFAAGADPIAYRLAHLSEPRLIAVINEVRTRTGWKAHRSFLGSGHGTGKVRRGRGIAAMRYEGTGGYAAVVVHVDVDVATGAVHVPHVWAAQDCGIAVNPDGMRAQAEGCVIQGISRATKEALKWTPHGITTVDWDTYPILTFEEMPETFEFQIIDRPDQPVLGAGEVCITAMPAAIANAIHDATGVRLREVPFTPARVKAALRAHGITPPEKRTPTKKHPPTKKHKALHT